MIHKHTEHTTQRHADINRIGQLKVVGLSTVRFQLKVVGLSTVRFASGDILQSLCEKQKSTQSDDQMIQSSDSFPHEQLRLLIQMECSHRILLFGDVDEGYLWSSPCTQFLQLSLVPNIPLH